MKKIIISIALVVLLIAYAIPVYAVPTLPHAFYGNVTINDAPAPNGTQVSAMVDVGDIVPTQNPVSTVGGEYGVNESYLLVQGNILNGDVITFYVDGVETSQTAIFESGGNPTEVDLKITVADPLPPIIYPDPAPSNPTPSTIGVDLFGSKEKFNISNSGKVLETVEATSDDGALAILISKGTVALGENGKRLKGLEVDVEKYPPALPVDTCIVGLAYDFGPDGATFEPPMTFTWKYTPDTVLEGELSLAYYDKASSTWVVLDSVVDTKNNTITTEVSHFTTFAIIAIEPIVEPPVKPMPAEPPVVIDPPVVIPVEPAPEPPVVDVPEFILPELLPSPILPPTPDVLPEPAPTTNWFVIIGIFAMLVIAVVVAVWIVKRKLSR